MVAAPFDRGNGARILALWRPDDEARARRSGDSHKERRPPPLPLLLARATLTAPNPQEDRWTAQRSGTRTRSRSAPAAPTRRRPTSTAASRTASSSTRPTPPGSTRCCRPGSRSPTRSPTCIAWARWVPFSSFGPYHEAYVMIRAMFERADLPLPAVHLRRQRDPARSPAARSGATRRSSRSSSAAGAAAARPFGEQMLFTVERPMGQRIMTDDDRLPSRLADPAELEDVPVLSTRVIPNSEDGQPPVGRRARPARRPATLHTSAGRHPEAVHRPRLADDGRASPRSTPGTCWRRLGSSSASSASSTSTSTTARSCTTTSRTRRSGRRTAWWRGRARLLSSGA